MLTPFRLARLFFHASALALSSRNNLTHVFGIVRAVNTDAQLAHQRAQLTSNPRVAAALDRRLRVTPDRDALRTLPDGTLGREFVRFLDDNGLNPDVLTDQTLGEDEWVSVHMYETHDLLHVLIGADATTLGEIHLQSFVLAQMPWERLAPVLFAAAFLRAALMPDVVSASDLHDAVVRGHTQGKRAQLFFGIDWNQRWDAPLAQIREELGMDTYDQLVAHAA